MIQLDSSIYESIQKEAIEKLIKYIQLDTSEKTGNVDLGVSFIEKILKDENIAYRVIVSNGGKKSILAHIRGDGTLKKSLVLLNHIDVVPANHTEWHFEPYGGAIIDNYICGRGSIDMKSMGIAELMSLLYIKRNQIKLKRDIYFLAVSDEEMGGIEGSKYVVDHYLSEINPQVVLDEGGWGSNVMGKNGPVFLVACGQKKGVFLKLKVSGTAGHASQPHKDNANDILIKALYKISNAKYPPCKDKELWKPIQLILRERNRLDYLLSLCYRFPGIKNILSRRLQNDKFLNSMIRNTITTTVIRSGKENNVIPGSAEAVLDCRITPNQTISEVLLWVNKIINDKRVEIHILKELKEASVSPYHTEFMSTINEVIQMNYKGGHLIPYITPLGTDAKYFREHGVEGVGLFPGILEEEDLNTMHGINEKLHIDVFKKSYKCIMEIVLKYCAKEGEVAWKH